MPDPDLGLTPVTPCAIWAHVTAHVHALSLTDPQGTAVAHADVVVSSQGAVLLALSKTDFLHALKAILGLRQQARFRKGLRWVGHPAHTRQAWRVAPGRQGIISRPRL